jgi:hypothetical protein
LYIIFSLQIRKGFATVSVNSIKNPLRESLMNPNYVASTFKTDVARMRPDSGAFAWISRLDFKVKTFPTSDSSIEMANQPRASTNANN